MAKKPARKMDMDELARQLSGAKPEPERTKSILPDIGTNRTAKSAAPRLAKEQSKLLPIEMVSVHPLNMRFQAALTEESCEVEIETIIQHGQTDPIEVIEAAEADTFLTIDGSRRLYSLQVAQQRYPDREEFGTVKAVVHRAGSLSDQEILTRSWLANEARRALCVWEQARYVTSFMDLQTHTPTSRDLAKHFRKSKTWASVMALFGRMNLPDLGLSGIEIEMMTYRSARDWTGADREDLTAAIRHARGQALVGQRFFAEVARQLKGEPPEKETQKDSETRTYGAIKVRYTIGAEKVSLDITPPKGRMVGRDIDTLFDELRRILQGDAESK